jgi:L-2,4-diaminobutyrate decarboxylase
MDEKLKKIYRSSEFNKIGHELVDLLTRYIEDSTSGNVKVMNWKEPEDHLKSWKSFDLTDKDPIKVFEEIINNSNRIHNPRYIGHQVCPPAPISALAGLVSELINNGMAIYEMGPAVTAIERIVIELIAEKIGYDEDGDGFITSGGTVGNLTALLAARQNAVDQDIWEEGLSDNLGIMVSEESHYSVDRAARIMGFGTKGIIKVPVNDDYTIDTGLLETYYNNAKNQGIRVIAIVGCAPSTSTGMYDDLIALGEFANKNNLWYHVDAAHGGGAIFSKKYKHLMKGADMADSVVIDGHKMLMTPALLTFVMFRNRHNSYTTFAQKAQYLWEKNQDEEWFNGARRTLECTKIALSIKFYAILATYGEEAFDISVTHLYDLGKTFTELLKDHPEFEVALQPHSNIVCFRYKPLSDDYDINKLNSDIRNEILKTGDFYIVQTLLNEDVYLRTTIMNPFTDEKIFTELMNSIVNLGANLLNNRN